MQEEQVKEEKLRIKPLEAIVDGAQCRVFGIFHRNSLASEYRSIFAQEDRAGENWLYEQGLRPFLSKELCATEVMDHSVFSIPFALKYGFYEGAVAPLSLCKAVANYIGAKRMVAQDIEHCAEHYVEANPTKPYENSTLRSAYQAEFLRNWRKGEQKSIVVGAFHAPEIIHFLENPIDDERIKELAQDHAQLAGSNYWEYQLVRQRTNLRTTVLMGLAATPPIFLYADMLTSIIKACS